MKYSLKRLKCILINLLFLSSYFDIFYLTPLSIFTDAFKVVVSIWGILLYIKYRKNIEGVINLFLVLFLILTVTSVYTSSTILKQPFSAGIISNINFLFCFGAVTYYYLAEKYGIDLFLSTFQSVFTKLLWINFIVLFAFSAFSISINVVSFTGTAIKINAARVSRAIIEFGTFYYFVRFIKSGNPLLLLYSLLLIIVFHLYDLQRVVLLTTFLSMALFVVYNIKKKVSRNFLMLTLSIFSFLIVSLSFTNILDKYFSDFGQAFKIFDFSANEVDQYSVRARIYEVQYALAQFLHHPILGNGVPRSSLKSDVLGDQYLYIADIGIFGILYSFGVLGIFIYIVQGIASIKVFLNKEFKNRVFLSCSIYLMYLFYKSFATAATLLNAHSFMFVLVLAILAKADEETAQVEMEDI